MIEKKDRLATWKTQMELGEKALGKRPATFFEALNARKTTQNDARTIFLQHLRELRDMGATSTALKKSEKTINKQADDMLRQYRKFRRNQRKQI